MSGQTVTKESIEARIAGVVYINAGDAARAEYGDSLSDDVLNNLGLVTICMIILDNGFKAEGVNACIDPTRYNKETGEQYAYENAFEKLWQLEGYLLREKMHLNGGSRGHQFIP